MKYKGVSTHPPDRTYVLGGRTVQVWERVNPDPKRLPQEPPRPDWYEKELARAMVELGRRQARAR